MRALIALGALAILALIVVSQTLYTVDETEYVVIRRFGEIQSVKTTPGLAVKTPFIDNVVRFDNRLLRIDMPTSPMPDRDSQFLDIDAYVRYRIVDPRKFLESLSDETVAGAAIGQIVISELRSAVGVRDRRDIIGGDPLTRPDGTIVVQPRTTAEGTPAREAMMRQVRDRSDVIVNAPENDFGIKIEDVRIKRADFPSAAEASVFQRMRTERKVRADKLRAEGEEQYLTITADVNRAVRVIRADAERDANILRGEGEAEAIRILADALERDPEFFAFRRSLEAYTNFLKENSTLVLSAESDLFRYLESPNPVSGQGDASETDSGQ